MGKKKKKKGYITTRLPEHMWPMHQRSRTEIDRKKEADKKKARGKRHDDDIG